MDPTDTQPAPFDFEECFHANYSRIARAIARIVGEPGRAEEIAVDAFWKLWRTPQAHGENAGGWLYRTAVRLSLNDLRGRERYEGQAKPSSAAPTSCSAAWSCSGARAMPTCCSGATDAVMTSWPRPSK